jgi:hypothetical protein
MTLTWAYRTGQSATTIWTPDKVAACPDPAIAFVGYVQQTTGTPAATAKDLAIVRKKAKAIFDQCPRADWYTLCRVVTWARGRRRRHAQVHYYVDDFRQAWAEGALPELDNQRREDTTEARIARALTTETDTLWRRRLIASSGMQARRDAIDEWERVRAR